MERSTHGRIITLMRNVDVLVRDFGVCRPAVAFVLFRALSSIRVRFLRMSDKCKLINVKRTAKHLWYIYNGLFVRTYKIITFQQSYLSHINIRFDSKRKSRDWSAP